jgi:hypothetical protein
MQQGDWPSAADLSIYVFKLDPSMAQERICGLWSDFNEEAGGDVAFQNALGEVQE